MQNPSKESVVCRINCELTEEGFLYVLEGRGKLLIFILHLSCISQRYILLL